MTSEQGKSTPEPEATPDPVVAVELEEVSLDDTEASVAESTEGKAEAEEEGEKSEDGVESIENKVTRLAQSMKDKELKPFYVERDGLKTQVAELETQLNDKIWDRHLQSLFNDEVEALGEDEAKIKQSDRQTVAGQVKEYHLKAAQVSKAQEEIDAKLPKLGVIERDQRARNDLWTLIFPEDKAKIARIETYLKRFEKAKDWDDYDLIIEGIKETIKGKKPPVIPDSSQSGGGAVTSDKQVMDNYQRDPKNPEFVKAYTEFRQRKGLTS